MKPVNTGTPGKSAGGGYNPNQPGQPRQPGQPGQPRQPGQGGQGMGKQQQGGMGKPQSSQQQMPGNKDKNPWTNK